MAAKPASTPRWASSPPAGAITEPTSGKKDVGWAPGERPPAQFFNWLLNLIYQWLEYLKDGAFTGNHSISGDFHVIGAFSEAEFDGDVAVDGDVEVGNDVVVDGDVDILGFYKRPSRTRHISCLAGQIVVGVNDSTRWGDNGGSWLGQADEVLQIPIILEEGEHLTRVRAMVNCNTGPEVTLTIKKVTVTDSVGLSIVTVGTPVTSVGGDNNEFIAVSDLNETAGADSSTVLTTWYAELLCDGDAGNNICYGIFVTTDIV